MGEAPLFGNTMMALTRHPDRARVSRFLVDRLGEGPLRSNAYQALGLLGDATVLPLLEEHVRGHLSNPAMHPSADGEVPYEVASEGIAALGACLRLDPAREDLRETLVALQEHPNSFVAHTARLTLGELGGMCM